MRSNLHFVFAIALGFLPPVLAAARDVDIVVANEEPLLSMYEDNDREFYRLQIGNVVSYFHQRTIGDAIVERDFMRYQFAVNTGELLERTIQWREDLPQVMEPAILAEEAEAIAGGVVQSSALYIISPVSYVFPLAQIPENPCWVVRSFIDDQLTISIVDATTGEFLGYGVPPPAEGYALTGPQDIPACSDPWDDWYINARDWFETMGYPTETDQFPTTGAVNGQVSDYETALFYELAHGGSTSFANGCASVTTATDVESWLGAYASMAFAFVGSCEGLCSTGDGTFAHEFRKGLDEGAVVVGYCHMDQPGCDACWGQSVDWQDELFDRLSVGDTAQQAFDAADLAYPACAGGACMRIEGDGDMCLSPKIYRSFCGEILGGLDATLTPKTRPYYVACDVTVPSWQDLSVAPSVIVAFLNDSHLEVNGTFEVTDSSSPVRLVREMDHSVGVLLTGGQIRISGGGMMQINE